MRDAVLKLDPRDNVLIALRDLRKCEQVSGSGWVLRSDVPAKHKFAAEELVPGSPVKMYGVGLAQRMRDIIDVDAGPVISGEKTADEMGDAILEFLIPVVSGEIRTKAEMLGQDDFIPWKRGVSL